MNIDTKTPPKNVGKQNPATNKNNYNRELGEWDEGLKKDKLELLSPHSRSQRLREGGIALLSRYRAPFLSRPHRDLLFKQPSSWHCWWRSGLSMWRAPLLQHLSLWSCLGEDKGWVADEKSIGLACEACQTGLALYICALHKS